MSLKQIKNKIASTQKTGKVTKAMEAVSAVKMRKCQQQAFAARPYAEAALRILRNLASAHDTALAPFQKSEASTNRQLLIIVTSDKGLAGSLNSAVLKAAEYFLNTHANTDVICVGRKASEFADRMNVTKLHTYVNVSDDVTAHDVHDIARSAAYGYGEAAYASVHVVYQRFVSTFEQQPALRQMFPLDTETFAAMLADVAPKKGKYASMTDEKTYEVPYYTIEPDAETLMETLMVQLTEAMCYHALSESKASEHSARMVAMKNATDKSKEITKALTVKFNKARQAAITAEVSEITAGVEAMK